MRIQKSENRTDADPYRQQKREVEQIVRRIDKKRSMQIFIQRSEGSLIQNEFKHKRKTNIKLQQQLKKSQQKQNQREKIRSKRNTISFNPIGKSSLLQQNPNQNSHEKNYMERRHFTQSPKIIADAVSKQRQIMHSNQQSPNNQKQGILVVIICENDAEKQKHKINQTQTSKNNPCNQSNARNAGNANNANKKHFIRPALQQLQQYLEQSNVQVLQLRRRIVEMLVLCLMRRCHHKLYEALDIAIETSTYFEDEHTQILLKSICLKLIGKLYKEIIIKESKTRVSIDTKLKSRSSQKLRKKRHSSFMIKTLASQRVFFTRFAHKYHKSKLLRQTSYRKEAQKLKQIQQQQKAELYKKTCQISGNSSSFKINPNNGNQHKSTKLLDQSVASIITKLNKKLAISLPSPNSLFPDSNQSQSNYNIVIHQRDTDSTNKLFPFEYPSSIQKFISKREYVHLISAVNSVIFSETQCYDFRQVLKRFISQSIILMLLLLVITLTLFNFDQDSASDWIVQFFLFAALIFNCSFFLKNSQRNAFGFGDRHQKMEFELQKWNKKYKQNRILFKTTQKCEALIICIHNEDNGYFNSRSEMEYADSINESSVDSEVQQSLNLNRPSKKSILEEVFIENQVKNSCCDKIQKQQMPAFYNLDEQQTNKHQYDSKMRSSNTYLQENIYQNEPNRAFSTVNPLDPVEKPHSSTQQLNPSVQPNSHAGENHSRRGYRSIKQIILVQNQENQCTGYQNSRQLQINKNKEYKPSGFQISKFTADLIKLTKSDLADQSKKSFQFLYYESLQIQQKAQKEDKSHLKSNIQKNLTKNIQTKHGSEHKLALHSIQAQLQVKNQESQVCTIPFVQYHNCLDIDFNIDSQSQDQVIQ